jgi:hypothetical protein
MCAAEFAPGAVEGASEMQTREEDRIETSRSTASSAVNPFKSKLPGGAIVKKP